MPILDIVLYYMRLTSDRTYFSLILVISTGIEVMDKQLNIYKYEAKIPA